MDSQFSHPQQTGPGDSADDDYGSIRLDYTGSDTLNHTTGTNHTGNNNLNNATGTSHSENIEETTRRRI